jgi:hypothetical protein
VIEEACEIAAARHGDTTEALPVTGPRHRLLSRETREPGEKVFKSSTRDDFEERDPRLRGGLRSERHLQVPEPAPIAGDAALRLERKYPGLALSKISGRV